MTPRTRTSRAAARAAVLTATVALAAACGSSNGTAPTASPEHEMAATPAAQVTSTPAADAKIVKITVSASSVDPSGSKVEVATGQPVVLRISSSRAGGLHVHSSPEHVVTFPAGDSEITLTFDQPGVVDVEDHDLDALIVRLEVR